MTAKALTATLPTFQGLDGLPLTAGYVYFGDPNQDPRQYPKTVFYDEALSVPAGTVLRTSAGYLFRNGSPTAIWSDGNCSVLVLDANQRQVYYFPDWSGAGAIADIAALSGSVADLAALAPHASDLGALGSHGADMGALAPRSADLGSLAPRAANIAALASDLANIDTAVANLATMTQALVAAATAGVYPNSAKTNVPRGLTQASVGAITAGSGGTNGTFAVAWSGGNFLVNPTANFTVAGGVLTAVTITGPGLYIGASPTVPTPSFAASAGLTGAAVALTAQFLVTAGQGYWVVSTDNLQLDRYKNVAGVATSDAASVPSVATANYFSLLSQQRTDLITQDGASIYTKANNTLASLVVASTGALQAVGGYQASEFMPVVGGYPVSLVGFGFVNDQVFAGYAWYDASQVYISGVTGTQTAGTVLTPPANAKYLRISGTNTSMTAAGGKVIVGKSPQSSKKLDIITNYDRDLTDAGYAHSLVGVNLHNPATDSFGILDSFTGAFSAGSGVTTDYMPISGGMPFFLTGATGSGLDAGHGTAFYDKDFVYISGIGGPIAAYTVNYAPLRARYVRTSCLSNTAALQGAEMYVMSPTHAKRLKSQWAEKNVITMGDSITVSSWPGTVCARLGATLKINAAFNGRTTARAFFKDDDTTPLTSADFTDVALLHVCLGVNNNTATIGNIGSALNSGTFYGDMKNIVETVMGWNASTRIVLSTLGYSSVRTAQTAAFNPAIKEIGAYYAIPVCDLYALNGISAFNAATELSDGLHPTATAQLRRNVPATTGFLRSIEPVL